MKTPAQTGGKSGFVSGFVSIIGRPNAGKSTLLNALIGTKVAIVAHQPQTTRNAIQGVLTTTEAQIIFLDTPGIHKSVSLLDKRMMASVRAALNERDLILFVADASRPFSDEDARAVDALKKTGIPVFLLPNKIDRLEDKAVLLPRIEEYKKLHDFAEYIPISARTGEGLEVLRRAVVTRLPEGPAYFPEDYLTNQPERVLAGELIREKILLETRQEVPHSVAVLVEQWNETPRITKIVAIIYVEKTGQKGIIIGAKGAMLKKIGTLAREEMENLFSRKIFLQLLVRVRANWREDPQFLNEADWHGKS